MEGSKIFCVRYQRFGNPFMEGSKDLLVLDTKDLGTLSWREVSDLLVLYTKDLGTLSWREVRIF